MISYSYEIGELGLDEQAMLLRAIEEKRFLPVGADKEVESDFQLIAGTNRDLKVGAIPPDFAKNLMIVYRERLRSRDLTRMGCRMGSSTSDTPHHECR